MRLARAKLYLVTIRPGDVSIDHIWRTLGVSRQSAYNTVRELMANGWVTAREEKRKTDMANGNTAGRKRHLYSLTKKGKTTLNCMSKV